MKNIRFWSLATVASLALAACGGGDGDQSPAVHYSALVSFGDSLSDVGSYRTAGLVAATGATGGDGGKFTINGPDGKNWTELLAAQLGVAAPCPAQTGLNSSGPLATLAAATVNHPGCYGYAQGGARVTNPVGPGNAALLPGDTSGLVGQLTDPVVNQINRHLAAVGGTFSGTELVTVMAGGNDVFINLAVLKATVTAAGQAAAAAPGATPTTIAAAVQAATQTAAQAAVVAMGTAGAQLAAYVNTLIIAKGATHVVVVNLPDVSQTPSSYAQDAATQALIQTMSSTFNAQLKAGLDGTAGVLQVDAYTQGQDQVAHPATYGITNVTEPACDPALQLFDSALVCSAATLITGDTSHYEFADGVHPTPYGYRLLAQFVTKRMLETGWL